MIVELKDYSCITKISKNPNKVRTPSMLGFARVPRFGDRLIVIGKGLEFPDRIRVLTTSLVQKVVKSGTSRYLIQTENSTYQLDRIGPCDEATSLAEFIARASIISENVSTSRRPKPRPRRHVSIRDFSGEAQDE